jgi:hypothetical protein
MLSSFRSDRTGTFYLGLRGTYEAPRRAPTTTERHGEDRPSLTAACRPCLLKPMSGGDRIDRSPPGYSSVTV